jgi:hypothetical protein
MVEKNFHFIVISSNVITALVPLQIMKSMYSIYIVNHKNS